MADANRVVVELIGNTSNLDAAVASGARSVDRAMATIAASASRAENQVKSSAGAIGFATRDLGFQIGDIGQQLSGGQSPFLIFAQQAPQVVDAISLISDRRDAWAGTQGHRPTWLPRGGIRDCDAADPGSVRRRVRL